jgi:uncharacterized membrane protein
MPRAPIRSVMGRCLSWVPVRQLQRLSEVRVVAAAGLIGGLGLVLALFRLTAKPFTADELFDVQVTHQSWPTYLHTAAAQEASQSVYLMIAKPWLTIVPQDEWFARLPSSVFAALACAMTVLVGVRLFDRFVGVSAGLLLASNALTVTWAQENRTFTLAAFAAATSTYLFVRALEDPTRARWLVYAAAASVGMYCEFFVVFVLLAHAAALIRFRPKPARRVLAPAAAVLGIGLLPAIGFVLFEDKGQVGWILRPTLSEIAETIFAVNGWNPVLLALSVLGAVTLLWTNRSRSSWQCVLVLTWAIGPFLLTALLSLEKPLWITRYFVMTTPAIALLAAVALSRLRALSQWLLPSVALPLAAFAAFSLIQRYEANPENWRAAATFAERSHARGYSIVGLPRDGMGPLFYYAKDSNLVNYVPRGSRAWIIIYDWGPQIHIRPPQQLPLRPAWNYRKTISFGSHILAELWTRPSRRATAK